MRGLSKLPPSDRKTFGKSLNTLKSSIEDAIASKKALLDAAQLDAAELSDETIDVTLPSRPTIGRLHPITQTIDEAIAILGEMGFVVAEGPEIEDDFHNFTALNIPSEHPARQMQILCYQKKRMAAEQFCATILHPCKLERWRLVSHPYVL